MFCPLTGRRDRVRLQASTLRVLDLTIATLGLLVAAPLLAVLYVVGSITVGDPVFRQARIGRDQRLFTLVKFRTMRVGTASVASHLVDPGATTSWGAFLRRLKLDELPQLWNVLRGEMSVVGPRPCLPSQTELIEARQRLGVLDVRPGITGLAQVEGIDMSEPARLAEVDAEMLRQLSPRLYVRLIVRTVAGGGRGDAVRS